MLFVMAVFMFLCCSQNGNLQAFPINLWFDLAFPEFFVCLLLFVFYTQTDEITSFQQQLGGAGAAYKLLNAHSACHGGFSLASRQLPLSAFRAI